MFLSLRAAWNEHFAFFSVKSTSLLSDVTGNMKSTFVTFHRKARLIEHCNLGQTAFQTPWNGVCEGFAKRLQRVWKKFEILLKGFGKRLKGFGRSLHYVWKRFKGVSKPFERSLESVWKEFAKGLQSVCIGVVKGKLQRVWNCLPKGLYVNKSHLSYNHKNSVC